MQLIKTLPQRLRRNLVPVPEFASSFAREVPASHQQLLPTLASYIREKKQVDVPLDAFRLEQLPPHLLMNFRVIDEHGRQLGMSRNFIQLHANLAPKISHEIIIQESSDEAKASEERYSEWSFGKFNESREVARAGQRVTLFNALVDEGDAVVLRTFDTRAEAQKIHRVGLRRLFMLLLKQQVKYLEKNMPNAQRLGMLFMQFGTQQELQHQILVTTFERCCLNDPLPTNETEFLKRGKEAKNRLQLVAQELAKLVANVLAEHQSVQKVLPQIKAQKQAYQDVCAQLDLLLHKHFIAETSYERLQQFPRYIKAISLRIEKLHSNPGRDAQCMMQMQPLMQAWQNFRQAQQGNEYQLLDEFAWMLQELRVSLFAQELKTPVIVSVKRLEKMLARIRG